MKCFFRLALWVALSCWVSLSLADGGDNFIVPMPNAGHLFESAVNASSQNPVSMLVTVMKTSNQPINSSSSQANINELLSDPTQVMNNLFTPNGLMQNVGVGLTLHF